MEETPEPNTARKSNADQFKSKNLVLYLKEQSHFISVLANHDLDGPQKLAEGLEAFPMLQESIDLFANTLGAVKKIQDLSVGQVFQITNKILDLQSFKDVQILDSVGFEFFELEQEQQLGALRDAIEIGADSESRLDTQEQEPEPKGHCCGHGPKSAAKPAPPKENKKKPTVERIFADYEDMDEYTLGFLERRKRYQEFQSLTAEMRTEQIQYILNTIKVLVLFLQICQKMQDGNFVPNRPKLDGFVLNLE